MTKDKDNFDWNEAADAGNLVVPEQKAIAVYWNPNGAAVIRQQGDYMLDNEDPFIVVQPGQLPSLIKRLEEMMHEGPPDET